MFVCSTLTVVHLTSIIAQGCTVVWNKSGISWKLVQQTRRVINVSSHFGSTGTPLEVSSSGTLVVSTPFAIRNHETQHTNYYGLTSSGWWSQRNVHDRKSIKKTTLPKPKADCFIRYTLGVYGRLLDMSR